LVNVKLTLPNGKEAELDALYHLGGRRMLWIESKSGRPAGAERYGEIGDALGIEPPARVLVAPAEAQHAARLFGLRGVSIEDAPQFFDTLAGGVP